MLRESVKDGSQIIQNILTQPLDIRGASGNVSLLSAAQDYLRTNGNSEELSLILKELVRYREPAETLLNELTIISNELKNFRP